MKLSAKLDAVAKAKKAYVLARTTLEQRLREQMREELTNLQTQVDIAVRYAYDTGESKASILRAMGTKDYGTLNASLERTRGVTEVVGDDPFGNVYEWVEQNVLRVTYVGHGVERYNGVATFDVKRLDDGKILLLGREPLWNDDYTVRNDAIALLDGKTDGFYYEEVIEWMHSK
jgi:hypothetical protein